MSAGTQSDISRTFRLCASGKSLSQSVVDRFRCRRTNSSCNHAHISAHTKTPKGNSYTCLRIRYITPDISHLLSSAHAHSLSLSLRLSLTSSAAAFLLVSRPLNLALFEPFSPAEFEWKTFSRAHWKFVGYLFGPRCDTSHHTPRRGMSAKILFTASRRAPLRASVLHPGTCQTKCVR